MFLAALFALLLGGFSSWRASSLGTGVLDLKSYTIRLDTRLRQWRSAVRLSDAERRLNDFYRLAVRRKVWLTTIDKIARILPDNQGEGLPASDKLWLVRLEVVAPQKEEDSVFKGILEAGTLVRRDGTHLAHIKRTLLIPLDKDEKGIFRNAREKLVQRSPDLRFTRKTGKERYLMERLVFDVDVQKIRGPE